MDVERLTRTLDSEPTDYRSADAPPASQKRPARPAYVWPPPNDAGKSRLALFCFEAPDGAIGQNVAKTATALAKRGQIVHLFSCQPFELSETNIRQHTVGECAGDDVCEQVDEFANRACNRFLRDVPDSRGITLLGYEWSAIPVMSMLHGIKGRPYVLSVQSLERQRSDLSSELSRKIEEIERAGLREAKTILHQTAATADAASQLWHCRERMVAAHAPFPTEEFAGRIDAGEVKARYQIGPVDPMVLYVGDLADHYGPELVIKALPAVLKNHPQARFAVAGCGDLYWPMRVYARYLLLDHAVRFVGDLQGRELFELIVAADIVIAPSRQPTPWWPIQAAWAARRPVVATHSTAPSLLQHEQDSVLCYPSVDSCVWGIERILYNPELGRTIGEKGHAKLEEQFGWNVVAKQIEQLIGAQQTV